MAASSVRKGVIWTGSDDGLVHVTKDGGKTWKNIGKSFPHTEITRTIREGTVRKGLLFVGTETGVFVSHSDGKSWRLTTATL